MGNSNKSSLRKSQSVPDTQRLAADAPVFDKQKSVSQIRLNNAHDKPVKPGKTGKKNKQQNEELPQLNPAEATFLPEFPLRGDLEELEFDILGVIAGGAFGNVIKVQKDDQKKFYAVKVLDKGQIMEEGAIRQCKDEATIQSMAGQHPFVVMAYEYWQSRRSLYIVLDYVPHGDMFTLWTFHGAFPERLVQLYIAEMAMVIDFLHNASVIYRDIKMENILFNAKGHIQLTDFGLAKWLQGGDQTRTVCGTLQYMAPEVLSVYPYSHSADWWSLGILMYAMLAGRYPVDGADTHTKMAQRVFECDFLLPSHIGDSAQDVINRVLTKSPHKRLSDVNSLQDLDFFQGIFFSDLIEQKLNPLDVVPEDFFPMTGQSWAPQDLTDEEQGHFDQFDDSNNTLTDEPGYPDYPRYHINPPASRHHPQPVHRLQPSQLYSQQSPQEHERQHSSQGEPQPRQQSRQLPHRKSFPDFQGVSTSHDTGLDVIARNPSLRDDRRLERPTSDYNNLQANSSDARLSMIHQSGDDGRSNVVLQPGYDSRISVPQNNFDTNNKERSDRNSEFSQISNTSQVRRSYGGITNSQSSLSNTGTDRRTNDDPGPVSLSSASSWNNINSSIGSTNRLSTGPEYKTVEAPPTVTLKTLPSQSSSQTKYNQTLLGYHSQTSVGIPAPSGYTLQNHMVNKQAVEIYPPAQETNYPTQASNSRINSNSAGYSGPSDTKYLDLGYKILEAPPTVSVPLAQISFSQNPVVPQNRDLQRLPPTASNFPNNFSRSSTNLTYTSSDYHRLEQAPPVMVNNTSQISAAPQRPSVQNKPVPPQKPTVGPKPTVPVRPVPTPRQSLRTNHRNGVQLNPESRVSLTPNQSPGVPSFGNQHPYTAVASHNQSSSPCFQNTNTITGSGDHQQDRNSQILLAADPARNRSASMSNMLTSSGRLDSSSKSPSIDDQNFQWKLPAGTTPSFV